MCVIFHLFQLSKMNNESFVEKLKKIAREMKEARRIILHEWERITTWRTGCYGRLNVERRTSSTSIHPKSLQVHSPFSFIDYDPARRIEERLHHSTRTKIEAQKRLCLLWEHAIFFFQVELKMVVLSKFSRWFFQKLKQST